MTEREKQISQMVLEILDHGGPSTSVLGVVTTKLQERGLYDDPSRVYVLLEKLNLIITRPADISMPNVVLGSITDKGRLVQNIGMKHYAPDKTPDIRTYKVFISHSSKDSVVVKSLVDILADPIGIPHPEIFATSAEGTGIESGEEWRNAIRDSLLDSAVVILLLSEHYRQSEICLNEMGAAWASDALVIPLTLPPTTFESVGVLAQVKQVEDLSQSKALDKLKDKLVTELGLNPNRIKSDRWTEKKESFLTQLTTEPTVKSSPAKPKAPAHEVKSSASSFDVNQGLLDSMSYHIGAQAKTGTFDTLDARVLREPSGTVSIWLNVTEGHNAETKVTTNMYLIAHDTERGTGRTINGEERYFNTWAIHRVRTKRGHEWRFTASNKDGDSTRDYFVDRRATSLGWHMFSVTWSKEENLVTFYVDGKKQKSGAFNLWPQVVNDNFSIGTWGEGRYTGFFAEGEVGHALSYKRALNSEDMLALFSATRPS